MTNHAAVWLDHKEARVFHFHDEVIDEATIKAPAHYVHKTDSDRSPPRDDKEYFAQIAKALQGSGKVLIVGPSTAKLDFVRYAHKSDHALEARIVAIETVDHPTDKQIIAYAMAYFNESPRLPLHHATTSAA